MQTEAHIDVFLRAMGEGDVTTAIGQLADTVELRSPIFVDPFVGKARVGEVLEALMQIVESFQPRLLLRNGADLIAMIRISHEGQEIDGFDHIHLDESGRIGGMTVAWRPLPAVVALQEILAPRLGVAAQRLVPKDHE